jgi:hypothetical protein
MTIERKASVSSTDYVDAQTAYSAALRDLVTS